MDPNRNEEEGAQGRPLAQWAYHEFHGKIAQVRKNNLSCVKIKVYNYNPLRWKVNLMDLDFFWISMARRMLATEPSWDTPSQVMEIGTNIEIEIIGIDIKIVIWLFLPLHQEWTSTRAGKTLTSCREAPSMPWLQGETDF